MDQNIDEVRETSSERHVDYVKNYENGDYIVPNDEVAYDINDYGENLDAEVSDRHEMISHLEDINQYVKKNEKFEAKKKSMKNERVYYLEQQLMNQRRQNTQLEREVDQLANLNKKSKLIAVENDELKDQLEKNEELQFQNKNLNKNVLTNNKIKRELDKPTQTKLNNLDIMKTYQKENRHAKKDLKNFYDQNYKIVNEILSNSECDYEKSKEPNRDRSMTYSSDIKNRNTFNEKITRMSKKDIKKVFRGQDSVGLYNFNKKPNYCRKASIENHCKTEKHTNNNFDDNESIQRTSAKTFGGTVMFSRKGNKKLQKLKSENEALKDCLLRIEQDHQQELCTINRTLNAY